MFTIEFLSSTSLLLLFRLVLSIALVVSIWVFSTNLYSEVRATNPNYNRILFRFGLVPVILIIILFSVTGGIVSPKGTITVQQQARPIQEEVVITTPPPRVEFKEGFTPLGQ